MYKARKNYIHWQKNSKHLHCLRVKYKNSIVNLTLVNCLFGAVKLTKHPNIDQYKYSGHGTKFDRGKVYLLGNGFGRNVIIFRADMSSSTKIDNRKMIF